MGILQALRNRKERKKQLKNPVIRKISEVIGFDAKDIYFVSNPTPRLQYKSGEAFSSDGRYSSEYAAGIDDIDFYKSTFEGWTYILHVRTGNRSIRQIALSPNADADAVIRACREFVETGFIANDDAARQIATETRVPL